MRRIPATLAVLALATVTTACGTLSPPGEQSVAKARLVDDRPVRDGGTLTIGLKSDPDMLDPSLTSTLVARTVFASMCEQLYDVDQHNKFVPQLADSLPVLTDGGKTFTFTVRRDARFSDGTPLDAAAVKTSLDRHLHLEGSGRASEIDSVRKVTTPGTYTVRLYLKHPDTPLLGRLANTAGLIMSPTAIKKYGKKFATHPSCVGPFKYEKRVIGDRIELKKDPLYYDADKVHLDGVTYKTITDGNIRMANIRSGDVQVGDQMGPVEVRSSLGEKGVQLLNTPSLGYMAMTLNVGNTHGISGKPGTVNSPFGRDVRVREALDLSLDRDLINKLVFQGMYAPACGPVPPGTPLSTPTPCPKRDIPKAKRLLKAAGVKTPVPLELMINTTPEDNRLGQVIQAMAKDAGFDIRLRPTEFATGLSRTLAGDFQSRTGGWGGQPDPAGNIDSLVGTAGSNNQGKLSDPVIDRLIVEGRSTADTAKRREIYRKLTLAINKQHSVLYLYRNINYVSASTDVSGIKLSGDGLIKAKEAGYVKGSR
ncbi:MULTISPECIES: ABC transporter substrate-binding protein [unclassified Streptomyces]|uniref:ABC transporter substrate-binding protein n=1 Tax=unclassified Streptomyces TaxID=2593676 RepID=UPI00081E8EE8|nr:ABC transporter substrate-binding protein [Streptomyces sp. LcepLS]MYR29510.1 ABC transporter substrate-binding protein [Streptomyces sp. SID4945]SCF46502.1 peptide/nickel transport system substrate-binding protein [Streptomyces sp. LcepLS]